MRNSLASYIEHPRAIRFETQTGKEELILLLRRHWITNLPWIAFTLVMVFIPVLFCLLESYGAFNLNGLLSFNARFAFILSWYLFTLGVAFEGFLVWYFNVIIITNKKVVDVGFSGLLRKSVSETTLENIEDVYSEVKGFWRAMLDYGDFYIQTAGEVPYIDFYAIPKPMKVQQLIMSLISGKVDQEP